jgi:hypothetical protein
MVVRVVKAVLRCWFAGLVALGSCDAYAPKPEASSPGASAAAPAAVPGASDPAECKDEVPPLDAVHKPVVSDDMLAPLAPCMKKLASVGTINVSFIVSEVGAIERVNVGGSTVDDCRAVACVKARLSKLRVAVPEPPYPTSHHASLKLFPRTSPRRLNEDEPPPLKSEAKFCADPEDPELLLSRLKPEVIQSAVRARYDSFRRCYEAGLAVNPTLTGRVDTRFIMDATVEFPRPTHRAPPCRTVASRNAFVTKLLKSSFQNRISAS